MVFCPSHVCCVIHLFSSPLLKSHKCARGSNTVSWFCVQVFYLLSYMSCVVSGKHIRQVEKLEVVTFLFNSKKCILAIPAFEFLYSLIAVFTWIACPEVSKQPPTHCQGIIYSGYLRLPDQTTCLTLLLCGVWATLFNSPVAISWPTLTTIIIIFYHS